MAATEAEQVMADAGTTENTDAGNDDGSATTLDDLIEQGAEPGVSEQAEAVDLKPETGDLKPEEDGEDPEQDAEDDEGDSLSDEDKAQLKQATTERIERKIGKAHAARKVAEEQAAELETERDELTTRLDELQGQLDAVDVNAASAASGVSDLLMVETQVALDGKEQQLEDGIESLQGWLDGHERDEVMTTVAGTEFAWADVKARQRALQKTLRRDLPKAQKVLERRQAATVLARKQYPALFKTTSAEHLELKSLLRSVPGLRASPDYHLMVGRMLAGKALEGAKPAKKAAADKPKPTAPKPPENATPTGKKTGLAANKHDPKKVRASGSWDDIL